MMVVVGHSGQDGAAHSAQEVHQQHRLVVGLTHR